MNVLASDPNAPAEPSGGTPLAAIPVLANSTAFEVFVGATQVGAFSVGDIIAVDADYQQQTGYVGSGISAAYVPPAADVNNAPPYLRPVTFPLGRVVQLPATSLVLAQALPGASPPT